MFKIHTNVFTTDQPLRDALKAIPHGGVTLGICDPRGSRQRDFGYEVALRGFGARHTRRPMHGMRDQGEDTYTATHDDWGWWLSALFDADPEMVTTYYKDRDDFHDKTHGAYAIVKEH